MSTDEIADLVVKLLKQKSELLSECFGITITETGELKALPQLIEGYIPDPDYLPAFILRLAHSVDWNVERQCFSDVSRARHF